MTDNKRVSNPFEYLTGAKPFPKENKFILGTFERGVTVYRQQIRALNLVYALVKAGKRLHIKPGARIAVIGGGAFGTTVAAAAAYAKFNVVLLERHQTLLHLQRGCDTRWLHPRFYDWPAAESQSQRARLPFLDWVASSAGNVAVQIEREISQLAKTDLAERLQIDRRVSDLNVERAANGIYEVSYRSAGHQFIRPSEVVIYAVGFGVESNNGNNNDSYWRNDRYGQSDLGFEGIKKIRYLVSGFGDGALVDVFRLTIQDFRYERIFGQMFPGDNTRVLRALNQVRQDPGSAPGSLYDKFVEFETGVHSAAIKDAKEELRKRIRLDTAVTLNGRDLSFRQGLSLRGISFSNALLAYLLFRLDAVKYERGSIDTSVDISQRKNRRLKRRAGANAHPEWLRAANLIILRHGTNRKKALQDVRCQGALSFLKSRRSVDTGTQIYPAGWWAQHVTQDPRAFTGNPKKFVVEYVPPVLRTHATTFVSTLASSLEALIDRRQKSRHSSEALNFRVTLHRLADFDRKKVFQQITPYKGRIESDFGVGRFFPVKGGIVGLACRTGCMVVAEKTDPAKFRKIWELTNLQLSGAKEIKPYVDSLLCCPFFAPESGKSRQRVILALFVDSADPKFFDQEALQTISSACRGFVDLLESLHDERMLHALPSSDTGYLVPPLPRYAALKRKLTRLGVKFVDATHTGWKKGVTFRTLKSVDLQVTYQEDTEAESA